MNFLYVGYYVEDSILYEIQKRKINNMSVARQNFEFNLLNNMKSALNSEDTIDYITYVPTDDNLVIPEFTELNGEKIHHIAINKKSPKSLLKSGRKFSKFLKDLGEEKLNNLRIIMYDSNPIFAWQVLRFKRKYGIKSISICAEIPLLRRGRDFSSQIKHMVLQFFATKFDGFVLLATAMAEKLGCENKPHLIVEGIAPNLFGKPSGEKKNVVMYAGGLARDNNIKLLIKSALKSEKLDELWICGVGPEQSFVEQAEKQDKRIKYFGMIENEKVKELETKAKLLVNLRSPDAELTKYSFPSKILEYMASGTLVASTKLRGIPNEYFDFIFSIEKIDEVSLTTMFDEIFSMSNEEYLGKCNKIQEFIEKNKKAKIQAKRIIDFAREF